MIGSDDPLSDVLDSVRLTGAVFFLWEPSWPFAYHLPDDHRIGECLTANTDRILSYHIVVDGPCWGAVAGEQPIALEPGDVFVVPHGDMYCMSSDAAEPSTDLADGTEFVLRQIRDGAHGRVVRDGGSGTQTNRIICGFMSCDIEPFNPVLGSLPRLLRVPRTEHKDALQPLIDLAIRESTEESRGGRSVLTKLSELLFIEILRRFVATDTGGTEGWLVGLRDPIVGRALSKIHRSPAERWTLERLAEAVNASRSTLADRFTSLVGVPPMQYLAQWRMQLAARRLADGEAKVYAVAQDVGYESEAAFSRAFKRIVGVAPTAWREQRGRTSNSPGRSVVG